MTGLAVVGLVGALLVELALAGAPRARSVGGLLHLPALAFWWVVLAVCSAILAGVL